MRGFSFLLGLCLAAPFSSLAEMVIRDYNQVNWKDMESFDEFSAAYLTGGRTNRNVLLGVFAPECRGDVETVGFRGAQRHSGNILQVISLPARAFPLPLSACSEMLLYRYNATLAEPHLRTSNFDHSHVNTWIADSLRTDMSITNGFDFPVVYYWQDESQKGKKQRLLAPGQSQTITSFLGHIFSAHRDNGMDNKPGEVRVCVGCL